MKKTEETEKGRRGRVYAEWYNPDNEVAVRTETNKKENDVKGKTNGNKNESYGHKWRVRVENDNRLKRT